MNGSADTSQRGPWPDEVQAFLATVNRGPAVGESVLGAGLAKHAERWSVGSATIYRFGGSPMEAAESVRADFVTVLTALETAAPFSIAPVLGWFEDWLVTTSPSGQPGHLPELHADPDDLVGALGQGLRQLHDSTPPAVIVPDQSESGSEQSEDPIVARCSAAVEAGLVDPATLPPPYDRYRPDELLAMLVENRPDPAINDEPPVWCHGAAVAERLVVDGGVFAGFDRMETPAVADRHLDLATMHQSVQLHFGPEAVFRFYQAYGRDPSLVLLDHYILASHLMGDGLVLGRPDGPQPGQAR